MNLKLVRLTSLSGEKASFYSVINEQTPNEPEFQRFLKVWSYDYEGKLIDFVKRIKSMANLTGAIESFFKLNEGKFGDNVAALFDEPDKEMRLFCIRLSEKLVILGNGGPKDVRTWQEDPILKEAAEYMISISNLLHQKLNNGSIQISGDGLKLIGNLQLTT